MRQTKREQDDARKAWLAERCGHTWAFVGKVVRCSLCNRKQGRNAPWRCPKRGLPNRWKMHWQRADRHAQYGQGKCAHCSFTGSAGEVQGHEYAKHPAHWIASRMQELKRAAKDLPQTDSVWKYHPIAVEYRQLLKRWWTLPAVSVQEAANLSPTVSDMLTTKGTVAAQHVSDPYLDRMFAKRASHMRNHLDGIYDPHGRAQEWRRQHNFTPLPFSAGAGTWERDA